jgi:hypothetical protein
MFVISKCVSVCFIGFFQFSYGNVFSSFHFFYLNALLPQATSPLLSLLPVTRQVYCIHDIVGEPARAQEERTALIESSSSHFF